jgi:hypothetical protein
VTRTLLLKQALRDAFPRVAFSVTARRHPEWHLVAWKDGPELAAVGAATERAGWRLWHPAPGGRGILVGWVNRTARAVVVAPAEQRRFLTRPEATYEFGLMDAAQRREPPDVRVAVRSRRTGQVVEAAAGEALHAQIRIRAGLCGEDGEDGWTAPLDSRKVHR